LRFHASTLQNILTAISTVLSSINNALQLPDRFKAASQSKWFFRAAIGIAFVAVAVDDGMNISQTFNVPGVGQNKMPKWAKPACQKHQLIVRR
jgi:hypothetical protein